MACKPQLYTGVTLPVRDALNTELSKMSLSLPPGGNGEISGMGVRARVQWEEATGNLTVEVLEKPFLFGCDFIYERIRQAIIKAGGPPA